MYTDLVKVFMKPPSPTRTGYQMLTSILKPENLKISIYRHNVGYRTREVIPD